MAIFTFFYIYRGNNLLNPLEQPCCNITIISWTPTNNNTGSSRYFVNIKFMNVKICLGMFSPIFAIITDIFASNKNEMSKFPVSGFIAAGNAIYNIPLAKIKI